MGRPSSSETLTETLRWAKFYGIPLIDYGPGRRGLLVGSGCGIMTSVMDVVPFRYCVDTDTLRGFTFLGELMARVGREETFVACVGWFSHHDPRPLRDACLTAEGYGVHVVTYAGQHGARLGTPGECQTLAGFIAVCRYERARRCFCNADEYGRDHARSCFAYGIPSSGTEVTND